MSNNVSSAEPPTAGLVTPAGVKIHKTDAGVSILLLRPKFQQLPFIVRNAILVGTPLIILFALINPLGRIIAMIYVPIAAALICLNLTLRSHWCIEGGMLSVQKQPVPGRRKWKATNVQEIKRAPGSEGLLINIRGQGFIEVMSPGDSEVLDFAAAVLNQGLTVARNSA